MSLLGKRTLVTFSNPSNDAYRVSEANESDGESSDGWEDSGDEADTSENGVPASGAPKTANTRKKCPVWSYSERFQLPETIKLDNFQDDPHGKKVMRDESAYKVYPGLTLPEELKSYSRVFICSRLFNSKMNHNVRVPDVKTKNIQYTRSTNVNEKGGTEETDEGIYIDPKSVRSVHFKKKCLQRKSGKKSVETGFKLGSPFSSFVPQGVDPQFVFIAVPMDQGTFLNKKAVRSEPYRVFSKRQPKYMPKNKRRRKHAEVRKMNTDIRHAEFTLSGLVREHTRLECANRQMRGFFNNIRTMVNDVENQTLKLALEFALRTSTQDELVML